MNTDEKLEKQRLQRQVEFVRKMNGVRHNLQKYIEQIYDIAERKTPPMSVDEAAMVVMVELSCIQTDKLDGIERNIAKLTEVLGKLAAAAGPMLGVDLEEGK